MGCQYFEVCEHGAETFTVAMPKLTFGRGCLSEAGPRFASRGIKKVALFTDSYLRDSEYVNTVRTSLIQSGMDVTTFSDIRIEPDDTSVMNGARFLNSDQFDGVVSVGGGSVIDTAKAAMIYALFPADFNDYFAPPIGLGKPIPGPLLPHLACPTTSGTGSECTSVSVVRINSLNTKFVLGSPHLLPVEALVDPSVCDTLPSNVVSSTGFDLLCHAIECYTAKAYTKWQKVTDPTARTFLQGANPWSDLAASKALEIAGKYLVRGVADNADTEARDQLMWGATLAGMAFGNSGTHLPHAMSYGVTHLMNDITTKDYEVKSPFVPHGLSVIVSAPAIFRHIAEGAPLRHMEAANYLGADSKGGTVDESGEIIAKRIIELMQQTGAPNGLSGVGFDESHVNALSDSSARQKRAIANTPKETNLTDIQNIYRDAIRYW
ncbi:MAG: iron-containing alcohol dehydrogenase [Gammaproteobacteria bacterium]|nr:iron-containing alcohol dehydrogenase [Gammaproteobacteria bacterium]